MIYRPGDPRILSRPVKLHWAGWETDTYRLQQAGWELSAEQNIASRSIRMVIRNEALGMIGQTLTTAWDYERMLDVGSLGVRDDYEEKYLQLRHMGRQIVVHNHGPMDFSPIDAQPQVTTSEVRSLDDLVHFAKAPLVRTQALVLPEPEVDDLLRMILERQQAAKTDYFRDIVAKEGGVAAPHKFHAQIISLPAAA